ncbi:MAG: hypothetical protein ABEH35_08695 [Haloarculaceae archaeon]
METWGWLIAYVVGFGLLQLFLYRYFQREDRSADTTPAPSDQSAPLAVDRPRETTEETHEDDGVHCKHCGTYNERDPMFSYCKECAQPLQ